MRCLRVRGLQEGATEGWLHHFFSITCTFVLLQLLEQLEMPAIGVKDEHEHPDARRFDETWSELHS